jgi:hypothetical protein
MSTLKLKIKEQIIDIDYELVSDNLVVEQVSPPTTTIGDIPVVLTPQPVVVTPTPTPVIEVGMEVVDISENFVGRNEIKLESGKHYKAGLIRSQMLHGRNVKIYSDNPENRPILEFGVKDYTPLKHGKQDGQLFMMHDNSSLVIENVDVCQDQQATTVETFNPRLFISAQWPSARWTAVVRNCDTTRLGKNGGFGVGLVYGGTQENHFGLINFKHFGTGLMDAKNPYKDGVLYVTLRDVDCYAREDAKLNQTDFQHIGSLKDNVLTFDGSVYSLTSGYNWTWMDNDSYIVLYDRYTFFLDGYASDTVVSDNQFRVRPQAKGKCTVGVLSANEIYSDVIEMHAGNKFNYQGQTYIIVSKDRISYPLFDDRTTEAKKEPLKSRALVYTLNRILPVTNQLIEIDYLSPQIEFTDKPITLLYKGNGGFKTNDYLTIYRQDDMLNSRGIGHLSYNHSDISMDAKNVKHLGFYRGSERGNGKSLIWNLDNCEGFEDSGVWFKTAIPVTRDQNLPLHSRIASLL